MKNYIIILSLVVIITQIPYIIGIRDLSQTIIDFILAILVYIPLGILLKKKLRKDNQGKHYINISFVGNKLLLYTCSTPCMIWLYHLIV